MADDGGEFRVRQGDLITIVLDENLTTGYEWAVEELDRFVLEPEDSEYEQGWRSGFGGGGQRTLTLRAARAGTGSARFRLEHPWGESDPVRRFGVTIHVSEGDE